MKPHKLPNLTDADTFILTIDKIKKKAIIT